MNTFFDSIHCTGEKHCIKCRDRNNGQQWRQSLQGSFVDILDIDFECPKRKPWIINKQKVTKIPEVVTMNGTQFRKIQNGYLIAPRRGPKPIPPEGYEVANGDDYVFLPKLPPCDVREKRMIHRSCCGNMERLFCKIEDGFVTRTHCQECKNAQLRTI